MLSSPGTPASTIKKASPYLTICTLDNEEYKVCTSTFSLILYELIPEHPEKKLASIKLVKIMKRFFKG